MVAVSASSRDALLLRGDDWRDQSGQFVRRYVRDSGERARNRGASGARSQKLALRARTSQAEKAARLTENELREIHGAIRQQADRDRDLARQSFGAAARHSNHNVPRLNQGRHSTRVGKRVLLSPIPFGASTSGPDEFALLGRQDRFVPPPLVPSRRLSYLRAPMPAVHAARWSAVCRARAAPVRPAPVRHHSAFGRPSLPVLIPSSNAARSDGARPVSQRFLCLLAAAQLHTNSLLH